MSQVSTPAIVLSAMRYGETSKIVRLATRDHGVQSAIAKGAFRPRSRFGAALQVLSAGQAHLLLSERRDLHILTGFDLARVPVELAQDLRRYATATALAEVFLRLVPADPEPGLFATLESALARLASAPATDLAALAVATLWELVGALGFSPSLEACSRDGRELPDGAAAFSAAEGGLLCAVCARTAETTTLPAEARAGLARLVGSVEPLPVLDGRHAAAHRRLVSRYLRHHVSEGAALPALDFWVARAWETP